MMMMMMMMMMIKYGRCCAIKEHERALYYGIIMVSIASYASYLH